MKRTILAPAVIAAIIVGLSGPTWAQSGKIDYVETSKRLVIQGGLALDSSDKYGAMSLFEQAIVSNPANANAYVGLGRVHGALGNANTSQKYFSTALEIDPVNLGALQGQALFYLSQDNVAEAEKVLNRIKRICGDAGCSEQTSVTEAISGYLEAHVAENKG